MLFFGLGRRGVSPHGFVSTVSVLLTTSSRPLLGVWRPTFLVGLAAGCRRTGGCPGVLRILPVIAWCGDGVGFELRWRCGG